LGFPEGGQGGGANVGARILRGGLGEGGDFVSDVSLGRKAKPAAKLRPLQKRRRESCGSACYYRRQDWRDWTGRGAKFGENL